LENFILFTKIKTTYVTKILGIDSVMLMAYFSIQVSNIIKGLYINYQLDALIIIYS